MLNVECFEENVPVSHGIAHLINRDFVSLHRDSESAKSLAQLEKNISLIGEIKKKMKPRLQASKRVVSLAKLSRGQKKIMNQNMKAFIRYLIVAICSAIVTFLSSSCTAGLVIGKNQRQHQENNISTKVDSTYYVPTITIR